MFGLFTRKASRNGWRKLSPGADIPVRPGQAFDLRFADGTELYGLRIGVPRVLTLSDGSPVNWTGQPMLPWALRSHPQNLVVIATHYRLHEPDAMTRTVERRALFESWLKDPAQPVAAPEPLLPKPARPREKVRS